MSRIRRRVLPIATVELARFLIGKRLVHVTRAGRIAGRIVETEAYPPGDPTGYARPGLTTSNAPLFAARGFGYVRMVYGGRIRVWSTWRADPDASARPWKLAAISAARTCAPATACSSSARAARRLPLR